MDETTLKEMVELIRSVECTLFYAKTEGTFDRENTKKEVELDHAKIRKFMEDNKELFIIKG